MNDYTVPLKDLLEAGCHFGHQAKRWNPHMKPYIYTVRDGVHIFDLVKTQEGLKQACEFIRDLVKSGKSVVFVGTKRQAKAIVKEEAQKAGAPYMSERWLGGTLTNWQQIKRSVAKLKGMREKREKGEYKKYTKKEQLLVDREIARLERFFGGLVDLTEVPEAMFIVDTHRETAAVKEALAKKVQIMAMVDTNADPELVDYVIPTNDDAVRAIKLVVEKVAEAVKEGKGLRQKKEGRLEVKAKTKAGRSKKGAE